jgi:hypothetical protein
VGARGRVIILNALPPNALPKARVRLDMEPVDIVELGHRLHEWLARGYELVHYVRHEATLRVISRELGIPLPEPNSDLYTYRDGDVLVIVTLKNPLRGREVQQVNIGDLEFWVVTVL